MTLEYREISRQNINSLFTDIVLGVPTNQTPRHVETAVIRWYLKIDTFINKLFDIFSILDESPGWNKDVV